MPPNKRNFYPSRSNNDHHQQTTHQSSSLLPSSSSPISIRATPLLELIASKCDPSHQSPDVISKPFFGTVLRSAIDRNIHKMAQLTNENPADVSYSLVTDAVNAGWCALGGSASHPNVRLTASGVKQLTASTSRYDLISFAAQFIAKQQQQEQQQQERETPKQSRNDNAMMMMLVPKPKSKNEQNKIKQQQNMNNDDDDDDIVLGYDPKVIIDDNGDDAVAVPSKSSTSANNSILSLPNPKSSLIRTKNDGRHPQEQQQQQQPKHTHHQRKSRAEEQERQLKMEEAERKRQVAENARKIEEEKKSRKERQATLVQKAKLTKKLRGSVKAGNYNDAINFCNEIFTLEGRKFTTNLLSRDHLKQLAENISSSVEEDDELHPNTNLEALCKATAVYSMAINKCDSSSDDDCNSVLSELLCGRSWCNNELANFNLARQDAEQVCEMYPEWSEGFLRKALACEGENDIAEAYKSFVKCLELKKSANDDDDTEFVEGKILGLRGKLTDARDAAFAEGNAQLQKKHFNAAIGYFDRALECDVSGSLTPEIFNRRSLCLIETGKDGEALEAAQAAIERQPLNPLHHYRAAEASEKIPDLDKAQQHIVKALELAVNAEGENVMAKQARKFKTRVEIALLKRDAPSLNPEQLFNEGTRLLQQNMWETAGFLFTHVIERSSSNSDLSARALLNRSKCYSLLKMFKESLSDATRCLEINSAAVSRKEILQRQYAGASNCKDWTTALKACEEYLELDPNDAEMRVQLKTAENLCPIRQKERREERGKRKEELKKRHEEEAKKARLRDQQRHRENVRILAINDQIEAEKREKKEKLAQEHFKMRSQVLLDCFKRNPRLFMPEERRRLNQRNYYEPKASSASSSPLIVYNPKTVSSVEWEKSGTVDGMNFTAVRFRRDDGEEGKNPINKNESQRTMAKTNYHRQQQQQQNPTPKLCRDYGVLGGAFERMCVSKTGSIYERGGNDDDDAEEEDDEEWSDIDEEEEWEEEEEDETNRTKESAGYQFVETMQRTLEKVHPYHSMHYTNESERNQNKRFAEEELRRRNLKNKRGGSFEEELDRIWLERISKTGSVHERAPGED